VFLLQSKSGSVIIYNFRKRKIVFQTEVAHISQVQKAKINMNNGQKMASCGFDGTLRIWDINCMQVVTVLEDRTSKKDKDD
jgi:WD40 repeat protein